MSRPAAAVHAERLLDGLDEHQRLAATLSSGPVAILAGAGSGKTRVVTRRVAYAVATGAADPARVLLVTFTEKAATEMVERIATLGLPRVAARTFHSAALAQLRHYWPSRHDGRPLPEVLADPWRLVAPLVRRLPGGYRFTATKDLLDEIGWAKSRRLTPTAYAQQLGARTPPLPVELFVQLYADYERARVRQGFIDFDDMLTLTVELYETDAEAARQVRGRYSWFSVDEYQDTNPLQQRLLDLWLGGRDDVCVVGDEDQTIYTFAGASPAHLTGFAARYPGARVVSLLRNYRSTPEILELANRLIAATGRSKRLLATLPSGHAPDVRSYPDAAAELAGLVAGIRDLELTGVPYREMAVLVRLNAQIPAIEDALTRAGLPYRVRGQRFFDRRDVRSAVAQVARADERNGDAALLDRVLARWQDELGFEPGREVERGEARERQSALTTLLAIVSEAVAAGATTSAELTAELERRDHAERSGSADGVELLTLHRAKGLEWDAVFLPSLEEGLLPVAQSSEDSGALEEERRLLYVGITRARRHLVLSWAEQRASTGGRSGHRRRSRFLDDIAPARPGSRIASRSTGMVGRGAPGGSVAGAASRRQGGTDTPLMAALRAWRLERARADGVPPYVIFPDSTLGELAERRPRTLTAVARVPGIGPSRLERYGAEIVAVLAAPAAGDAD